MSKRKTPQERDEARAELRKLLPPGATVHTITRHCSRSGMQRSISCIVQGDDGPREITYLVARALDENIDQKHGGIKVGGCGMDMGFSLVYNLAYTLYPNGFGCSGEGCRSNDHSNGDRDYTPDGRIDRVHTGKGGLVKREHWHRDGGYAIRQVWL